MNVDDERAATGEEIVRVDRVVAEVRRDDVPREVFAERSDARDVGIVVAEACRRLRSSGLAMPAARVFSARSIESFWEAIEE